MRGLAWAKQVWFLVLFFVGLFIIKVAGYLFSDRTDWHQKRGDAEQYHAFALGLDDRAYSVWSWILRFLHEINLYSREGVSVVLFLLASLIVPILAGYSAIPGWAARRRDYTDGTDTRAFWLTSIVVALYPPLLYFSLDIYRDVFMVFVFCIGLLAVKASIEVESTAWRCAWLTTGVAIAYVLYLLRPYLGFGFVVALAGMHIFHLHNAKLRAWSIFYLLCVWIFFGVGMLDTVAIDYREGFSRVDAGSTFGIKFNEILLFLPQFLQSWIYQIGGLYFHKPIALLPFLFESVPFMLMAGYVLKNRRYADRFVDFLVVFFFVYATIWVLGNDNLGTAIRLRMFNYLAVMIAWGTVIRRKQFAHALQRSCT